MNIIKEQEEEILHIPSLDFVNGNWNTLVQFLEYEGSPKWSFGTYLDLEGRTDITSLHNLVYVDGYLDLTGTSIKTLGSLKRVNGSLDITGIRTLISLGELDSVELEFWASFTNIKSLENLRYVGGNLRLFDCKNITSIGKLEYVGDNIMLRGSTLPDHYTRAELENKVNIGGHVIN